MSAKIACFKKISSSFKLASLCAGITDTIVFKTAGNLSSSSVQKVFIVFLNKYGIIFIKN